MPNSTMQEWLNLNAHRRFPLVDDSDLSCESGVELPNAALLDARFCMFGVTDGNVLLKSASIHGGVVSLSFALPGIDDPAVIESRGFCAWSSSDFSARVYTGSPESLDGLDGDYVLRKPARILRSRVLSVPFGIGADTLSCGRVSACGDIRVADGHNTTLNISKNNLVLGLRRGAGLGVSCPDVEQSYLCGGSALYFLNGQKADSNGDIGIYGGEGITVSSGTYMGIPAVIVCTSKAVNRFAYKR